MDLIYTDPSRNELGFLTGFDFDLEDSKDKHDFQLVVPKNMRGVLHDGCYVYVRERPNFGGRISKIKRVTNQETIKLMGRTWLGMLSTKIVCPPSDQAYLSYPANDMISEITETLLRNCGLLFEIVNDELPNDKALFVVKPSDTVLTERFQFDRYCDLLYGLKDLYSSCGLMLRCGYDRVNKVAKLSGYTASQISVEEFSSYQYNLDIEKDYDPVNHIIALGSGELKNRHVYHVLLNQNTGDADVFKERGSLSYPAYDPTDQSYQNVYSLGADEVVEIYEYSNAEDDQELVNGAKKRLKERQSGTSVAIDLDDVELNIGDSVTGIDELTGISVTKKVAGVIFKANDNTFSIDYKMED